MTSFLVTLFSNLHIFVEFSESYQLATFQCCRLSGNVLQRDFKSTLMTSLWRHFMILEFETFIFCETGYKLSTCQVSNPSVIWIKFYRGISLDTPKNHYDVIMTSLHSIWLSKLYILKNVINSISLPNFIGLDCLNQILRGLVENTPSQTYMLSKSPVLIRLNLLCYSIF